MSKEITLKRRTVTLSVVMILVFSFLSVYAVLPGVYADTVSDRVTTNIPDTDISGATGGRETENSPGSGDTVSGTVSGTVSDTEVTTPLQTTPESTAPMQTTAQQTTQNAPDTGDGNGWIIAVIVIAVIAAVIIAIIALMPKKRDL